MVPQGSALQPCFSFSSHSANVWGLTMSRTFSEITYSKVRHPPLWADSQAKVQLGPSPGFRSHSSSHLQMYLHGCPRHTSNFTCPPDHISSLALYSPQHVLPFLAVPCFLSGSTLSAQMSVHIKLIHGSHRWVLPEQRKEAFWSRGVQWAMFSNESGC